MVPGMSQPPDDLLCESRENPLGLDEIHPSFSWKVRTAAPGRRQSAYELLVSSSADLLHQNVGDLWTSGRITSPQCHDIVYSGKTLGSRQICHWKVRCWDENDEASPYSAAATFEMGLLHKEDWRAEWIGWPAGHPGLAAYFRCPFHLDFKPKRAIVYSSGLGLYQAYVNGVRMPGLLQPAVSDFGKRIYYNTHDVTGDLHEGENVVAATVGGGWYGTPILLVQLEIHGPEGQLVVVDTTRERGTPIWMVSNGPIRLNSLFDGESYDATQEKPGWDKPDYVRVMEPRADIWLGACVVRPPGGRLRAQPIEAIGIVRELPVEKLTEPKPGVFVFDFGQNHAGWARLTVEGPRGTILSLKYAESLNADGTVNQENLRSALATDTYVLSGQGPETWEPSFTYHGYRYVQAEGWPGRPDPNSLTACVVRSPLPSRGRFSCDNALLNRIHQMVRWTEESNLHGIPTDCPQRDERMGWLNDMAARSEELIYNFEGANFLTKFVSDIADAQLENGAIGDTAPYQSGYRPADPVSIAFLLIPFLLYQHYGDTRAMTRHYESMRRWVDYLSSRSEGGLLKYSNFGDWAPPAEEGVVGSEGVGALSAKTPGELVSTAFHHGSLTLLARISDILGKSTESFYYHAAAAEVRKAFHANYWSESLSGYGSGNQACNAIALYFDVVPSHLRRRVVQSLVTDVERRGFHLNTGNLSTKYLLEVLSQEGFADVAFKIATQTTYPSWGFMLEKGATTLWERWEELHGGGMNSHNHAMLGSIGSWFYRHVAGIFMETTESQPPHVVIRIPTVTEVSMAEATLPTIWGEVAVAWKKTADSINVSVSIPWNCPAVFHDQDSIRTILPGQHEFRFPYKPN